MPAGGVFEVRQVDDGQVVAIVDARIGGAPGGTWLRSPSRTKTTLEATRPVPRFSAPSSSAATRDRGRQDGSRCGQRGRTRTTSADRRWLSSAARRTPRTGSRSRTRAVGPPSSAVSNSRTGREVDGVGDSAASWNLRGSSATDRSSSRATAQPRLASVATPAALRLTRLLDVEQNGGQLVPRRRAAATAPAAASARGSTRRPGRVSERSAPRAARHARAVASTGIERRQDRMGAGCQHGR